MKNHALKVFAASAIFLMIMGAAVYAQSEPRVIVNIPFAFTAGRQTLPAGEYTIERTSFNDPDLLLFRNQDTRASLFLLVEDTQAMRTPERTELVFNEIGDRYFLSKIWVAGEDIGREVPKPRAERELERSQTSHMTKAVIIRPDMPCHCVS